MGRTLDASSPYPAVGGRSSAIDLLRRLALNDERVLEMVLHDRCEPTGGTELGPKVELLVELAALLAVGAVTPSLREAVDHATVAGASRSEIVGVLVPVGPTIGLASLVVSAPKLAMAIGYDLEDGHSRCRGARGRPVSTRSAWRWVGWWAQWAYRWQRCCWRA
jgi:4-carboxymuconolactone decarboxylase